MYPQAQDLLTLGQKQKTTGVKVSGELREAVGCVCRCDLSSPNSKLHTAVFSSIRFQELLSGCKMVLLQSRINSLEVQGFNLIVLISAQLGSEGRQWQCSFKARGNVEVQCPKWWRTYLNAQPRLRSSGMVRERGWRRQRWKMPRLDFILALECLTWNARSAQFRGTSQSCLSHAEEGLQPIPPGLSSAPCDPRDHLSYESTVSLSSIDWVLDKSTQEKGVPWSRTWPPLLGHQLLKSQDSHQQTLKVLVFI